MIVDFNHETAQKVFGGEIRSHVLLFLSKDAGHYDKYLENHRPVAKDYKDKVNIDFQCYLINGMANGQTNA